MSRILQLVVALSLDGFQCGALINNAVRLHKELDKQADATDNMDPFQELGHQADNTDHFHQKLGHQADNMDHFHQQLGHQADNMDHFHQKLGHQADNTDHFHQELGHQADNTDHFHQELGHLADNTLTVVEQAEDYYTQIGRQAEKFNKHLGREARTLFAGIFTSDQLLEFRGDILVKIFEWLGLIVLRWLGI